MKRIILTFIIFFIFTISISAECTEQAYANLVFEAKAVKYNYELYDTGQQGIVRTMRYKVTASEISPNLIIKYDETGEILTTRNSVNGLMPGTLSSFSIYGSEKTACYNIDLDDKNITLPEYNSFISTKECEYSPEFEYCNKNKSYSNSMTYEDFINKYNVFMSEKDPKEPKEETTKINIKNGKKIDPIIIIIISSLIIISISIISISYIIKKRRII